MSTTRAVLFFHTFAFMKRFLAIFFFIVISLSFIVPDETESCTVKFNGIYAYKLNEEQSAVIRFYEDGTVLASTSVNDYMDVFSWFHKENKDMVLSGKYKIDDCEIKFEVKGMTGEQKYKGVVSEKTIDFKLSDVASKKTVLRTYTFFAL